ncbi:MAG: hypothetical protein LC733_00820 [Actinobacteria bacterium]|nr:hypothetical protein [Actinomycetota bacterium]
MEDLEVIDAFVNGSSRRAFGTGLHVEADVLMLDGWWHVCVRISDDAFIVRNEEPPRETTALRDVGAALAAKGLTNVGTDLPAITVITYTTITLGFVSWNLWSVDLPQGEAALAAKATAESFLENRTYFEPAREADYNTAELGGARRNAGLPPSVVLTVGLDQTTVAPLEETLADCRFESRAFGEITPDGCGSLIPTLVLIDASEQQGKDFCMQFRAAACGRFIPVLAVTPDAVPPLGADMAVSSGQDPHAWIQPIRTLLP